MTPHELELVLLIRSSERVMGMLQAVRSLGLENWCIAAGTIRNLVWDHLHEFEEPTLPSDIDVLIFDPDKLAPEFEADLETQLSAIVGDVSWEVVNQATVHQYTGDPEPYESITHAMSRWADLVTAVGATLSTDDQISIVAPASLSDLFNMRVRPNIATPTSATVYRERMTSKRWQDRWPLLTIEDLPE